MAQPARSRMQVVTYLVIVLAFSSFFYFLILHSGSLGYGRGMYVFGLMWCPALAGMLTLRLNGRSISDLGWKWGETKYQIRSWYIPLLYASIAYAIVWIFHFGAFGNPDFYDSLAKSMHLGGPRWISIVLGIALIGTYGIVRSVASALGEEIGWRGFLVPELSKTTSFTATSLISGIVWSLWHYPILIFSDYNAGTPTWYGLSCFTVMVISISFVFAWMRLKSGSLWTAAILHGSHNLYVQAIFTPITRDTGKTKWFIDEFGCVLPIVAIAFAIYFWSKRRELPAPQA
ncbi:MAG TPA: type II CAAX endopeptidase family protein [Candidatus Solibacter sp.]|nr:type II CAAX endopeptidase family protein [Candidatus Solibacter sp.]